MYLMLEFVNYILQAGDYAGLLLHCVSAHTEVGLQTEVFFL